MLEGVDVSHWQGSINWAVVKPHISFAILKCTEGATYFDDTYVVNKQGCIDNGIPHGAYHFFRTNVNPVTQADYFHAHIGSNMNMLVCDVETNDGGDLKANLRAFVERFEDISGVRPWIYTAPAFWRAYGIHDEQWCVYFPLWIANYCVSQPTVPPGWSFWDMWQYSDKGVVPGIPGNTVDLNRFDGTESELMQIFRNGVVVPPALPDKVRVIANTLYIRAKPMGSVTGYMPNGFIVHPTGSKVDSTGVLWYQSGPLGYFSSKWVEVVQ